jgi:hypothetical protein
MPAVLTRGQLHGQLDGHHPEEQDQVEVCKSECSSLRAGSRLSQQTHAMPAVLR